MDDRYNFASHSPQTVTDAFGTPPGRTMIDRYLESSYLTDDPSRYREPVPNSLSYNPQAFEARTCWQTSIWAIIVISVILGVVFL